MGKRIIFSLFSLIGMLAQPVMANDGMSEWDKLMAEANKTLQVEQPSATSTPAAAPATPAGNQENPSWDTMVKRSNTAMDRFSDNGQGFDITSTDKRAVTKLSADGASTLTGRFYDLKQPISKDAKPLYNHQVVSFIKNFMDADWDPSMLEQYYSPDVKLEAPYLYLPRCKASYAPEAFQCNSGNQERKVAPQNWVVHYSGTVIAPESGNFRFVGMGDDAIVVRFDNKVVLEAGWSIPSRDHMTLGISREYQNEITSPKGGCALYQYKSIPHWNKMLGGLPSGRHFHVTKGKAYPIEILLSEIPGNEFGYCLLIEKVKGNGDRGKFSPEESPTLALFRTNEMLPDLKEISEMFKKNGINYAVGKELEAPPFKEDSPIWVLTEETKQKRSTMERVSAINLNSEDDTAMGRRNKRNASDSSGNNCIQKARKKVKKGKKSKKLNLN